MSLTLVLERRTPGKWATAELPDNPRAPATEAEKSHAIPAQNAQHARTRISVQRTEYMPSIWSIGSRDPLVDDVFSC